MQRKDLHSRSVTGAKVLSRTRNAADFRKPGISRSRASHGDIAEEPCDLRPAGRTNFHRRRCTRHCLDNTGPAETSLPVHRRLVAVSSSRKLKIDTDFGKICPPSNTRVMESTSKLVFSTADFLGFEPQLLWCVAVDSTVLCKALMVERFRRTRARAESIDPCRIKSCWVYWRPDSRRTTGAFPVWVASHGNIAFPRQQTMEIDPAHRTIIEGRI